MMTVVGKREHIVLITSLYMHNPNDIDKWRNDKNLIAEIGKETSTVVKVKVTML